MIKQRASLFISNSLGYIFTHILTMQADKYIHARVLPIHSDYNTSTPGLKNKPPAVACMACSESQSVHIYTVNTCVIRPFLFVHTHPSVHLRLKCFRETDLLCCRHKVEFIVL